MRTGIYVSVFFFFLAQRASQASEKRPHAHPLWCVYTTGPLIVCKKAQHSFYTTVSFVNLLNI